MRSKPKHNERESERSNHLREVRHQPNDTFYTAEDLGPGSSWSTGQGLHFFPGEKTSGHVWV